MRYDYLHDIDEARKEDEKIEKEILKDRDKKLGERMRRYDAKIDRKYALIKSLRSPEKIARDELRGLDEFRGDLTGDEYRRGKSQIAEKLMGAMGGGEIQTVGMMSAGSAELHSLSRRVHPGILLVSHDLYDPRQAAIFFDAPAGWQCDNRRMGPGIYRRRRDAPIRHRGRADETRAHHEDRPHN
jgi:hypothetical protein